MSWCKTLCPLVIWGISQVVWIDQLPYICIMHVFWKKSRFVGSFFRLLRPIFAFCGPLTSSSCSVFGVFDGRDVTKPWPIRSSFGPVHRNLILSDRPLCHGYGRRSNDAKHVIWCGMLLMLINSHKYSKRLPLLVVHCVYRNSLFSSLSPCHLYPSHVRNSNVSYKSMIDQS